MQGDSVRCPRKLNVLPVATRLCAAAIVGIAVLVSAGAGSATAQPASREDMSPLYFGGSIAWTHHTGWVPNKSPGEAGSVESWVLGGKIFGGYRLSEALSLEVAYHHLGKVSYWEGFGALLAESRVRSYAVSGSVVYAFPPLQQWFDFLRVFPPARIFLRGGFAYKNMLQDTIQGSFEEGTLSAVLGVGVHYQLTPRWFSRIEIEHLSGAIGGPVHDLPLLKGLVNVRIGGTDHVPNLMHTQVLFTLGYNL